MAKEYESKGFKFIFVYAREAHPGEQLPPLRSLEQKLKHAQRFKDEYGLQRSILIDDMVGTGHRLYGMLPNVTYLIGRSGLVLFRSDWTDPPTIRMALDYVIGQRGRREEGQRLAPFYAELAVARTNDTAAFKEGLLRAGPQALTDFEAVSQRLGI